MESQTNLLEIIAALSPPGGFACLLNSWQQESDEDGNNGNDHEQLNQRKAS